MTSKITEMVRNDNMAEFEFYHDGALWYRVMWMNGDLQPEVFKFPVPVEDIGNATFNRVEKALLMMRYIRKHLKVVEQQENEQN